MNELLMIQVTLIICSRPCENSLRLIIAEFHHLFSSLTQRNGVDRQNIRKYKKDRQTYSAREFLDLS